MRLFFKMKNKKVIEEKSKLCLDQAIENRRKVSDVDFMSKTLLMRSEN